MLLGDSVSMFVDIVMFVVALSEVTELMHNEEL